MFLTTMYLKIKNLWDKYVRQPKTQNVIKYDPDEIKKRMNDIIETEDDSGSDYHYGGEYPYNNFY